MLFVHFLLYIFATLAVADPIVYLIRHGEKPPNDENGLNAQGLQRAQCLRSVFSKTSSYKIGYILAQTPKSDGRRERPYDTVAPLASDLGLQVDTSCDRDDPKCVKKAIRRYAGAGNILICWEHHALTDIMAELGDKDAPVYPDDKFDQIWTVLSPYKNVTSTTSERCAGLDG